MEIKEDKWRAPEDNVHSLGDIVSSVVKKIEKEHDAVVSSYKSCVAELEEEVDDLKAKIEMLQLANATVKKEAVDTFNLTKGGLPLQQFSSLESLLTAHENNVPELMLQLTTTYRSHMASNSDEASAEKLQHRVQLMFLEEHLWKVARAPVTYPLQLTLGSYFYLKRIPTGVMNDLARLRVLPSMSIIKRHLEDLASLSKPISGSFSNDAEVETSIIGDNFDLASRTNHPTQDTPTTFINAYQHLELACLYPMDDKIFKEKSGITSTTWLKRMFLNKISSEHLIWAGYNAIQQDVAEQHFIRHPSDSKRLVEYYILTPIMPGDLLMQHVPGDHGWTKGFMEKTMFSDL